MQLKESIEDPLIEATLSFFSYVASIVEPYLKKYQTDSPMNPFMYNDLKLLANNLLALVVKAKMIEGKSGKQLKEIDLDDSNKLLALRDVIPGFATEHVIKKLQNADLPGMSQIADFRKGAQVFVISILHKLFEKSPLGSMFLHSANMFDPSFLSESSKNIVIKRFKTLLEQLMKLNILAPKQCDQATAKFNYFLENELKKHQLEFSGFDQKKMRLDHFYFRIFMVEKYDVLSFILRLIFCMSHGQASVERGFSLNNSVIQTNISPATIVSKRIIQDHMLANKLTPEEGFH